MTSDRMMPDPVDGFHVGEHFLPWGTTARQAMPPGLLGGITPDRGGRDPGRRRRAPGACDRGVAGGTWLAKPDLGSVNSDARLRRIAGHVAGARARGCVVVTGGNTMQPAGAGGGWFHAPTLVESADPQDTIAQDEILGPVLTPTVRRSRWWPGSRDLAREHRFARDVVLARTMWTRSSPSARKRRSAGAGPQGSGGRRGWRA